MQICAVRISPILLDGCIIHQTRLASGKILNPATLKVVFVFVEKPLYRLQPHPLRRCLLWANNTVCQIHSVFSWINYSSLGKELNKPVLY